MESRICSAKCTLSLTSAMSCTTFIVVQPPSSIHPTTELGFELASASYVFLFPVGQFNTHDQLMLSAITLSKIHFSFFFIENKKQTYFIAFSQWQLAMQIPGLQGKYTKQCQRLPTHLYMIYVYISMIHSYRGTDYTLLLFFKIYVFKVVSPTHAVNSLHRVAEEIDISKQKNYLHGQRPLKFH